jgi:ribosomal protein S14
MAGSNTENTNLEVGRLTVRHYLGCLRCYRHLGTYREASGWLRCPMYVCRNVTASLATFFKIKRTCWQI